MSKASGEADGSNVCNVDGAEMQPMTSDADDVHAALSETQAGHKRRRAVRITVALISLEALCWLFGGEKLYHELQSALELHPRSRPHASTSAKRGAPKRRPKQGGRANKGNAAQPYAIDKSTKREYQKWHARVRKLSQMQLQPSDWTPDVNWTDHPTKRADRFPSVQERAEYYMGRWHDASIPLYGSGFDKNTYIQRKTTREYGPFSDILVNLYGMDRDRLWQCYQNKKDLKVFSPYCRDYIDVAILHSKGSANVLHYIGDGLPFVPQELTRYPVFAKVRAFCSDDRGGLGDDGVRLENGMCRSKKKVDPIVLPLNRKRHYAAAAAVPQNDIPWEEKRGKAVWRGQYGKIHDAISNTNDVKHALVWRHLNSTLVDAKFSKHKKDAPPEMVGDYLDVASQLRYKYVISIEGNDVSSGLKWMLLSNSVVLMPPITWESWAMEGLLKPFVHYLPLQVDMSNVEDMVRWAETHPEETRLIAERSTLFMFDLLFHPDATKDEQRIMIQMMERFERNFGSKERREAMEMTPTLQLPSVEERVKHAMGRWYHNNTGLSMKRSSKNGLPRSISRSMTRDGLFIASGSHLASCAMPNSTHPMDIRALCQLSLPEFDERHTADLKSSSFNRLRKTKKGERMRLATVSSWRHDGKGTKQSKRVLLDDSVKIICFGDCSRDGAGIPYFAGSRKNGADGDGILWPFGFDEAVSAAKSGRFETADDRFEKKTPTAVVGGIDTKEATGEDSERKDRISQMLVHRYLVAVEHEDGVNNDLLWMLLSRSVVLMPEERRTTSWLLEESLQPYVHYLPLRADMSNVEEVVQWAETHPEETHRIAERSTLFAQQLLLDTEEVKLRVMERYTSLFGGAGGGLDHEHAASRRRQRPRGRRDHPRQAPAPPLEAAGRGGHRNAPLPKGPEASPRQPHVWGGLRDFAQRLIHGPGQRYPRQSATWLHLRASCWRGRRALRWLNVPPLRGHRIAPKPGHSPHQRDLGRRAPWVGQTQDHRHRRLQEEVPPVRVQSSEEEPDGRRGHSGGANVRLRVALQYAQGGDRAARRTKGMGAVRAVVVEQGEGGRDERIEAAQCRVDQFVRIVERCVDVGYDSSLSSSSSEEENPSLCVFIDDTKQQQPWHALCNNGTCNWKIRGKCDDISSEIEEERLG